MSNPRPEIICTSPQWLLNGVNTVCLRLVRELVRRGYPAQILQTWPCYQPERKLTEPNDIPYQQLSRDRDLTWRDRCRKLIDYLEDRAPCIYLPNHDYRLSCVAPELPADVGIVGILHSDDPEHYKHVRRVGRYWNRIVAVSSTVAHEIHEREPAFSERVAVIPYGVSVPSRCSKDFQNTTLRLVYAGRLVQHQKRVMDLARVGKSLAQKGTDFQFTVVGEGEERNRLETAAQSLIQNGFMQFLGQRSHSDVLSLFDQSHVFVLTSDFEGMPLAMMEAMARGCVPVVTDVESGVPQLIDHGKNGYVVSPGDIEALTKYIHELGDNRQRLKTFSRRSRATIRDGGFTTEDMAKHYVRLFEDVGEEIREGGFARPKGRIHMPEGYGLTWKDRLPTPVCKLGVGLKNNLRRILKWN